MKKRARDIFDQPSQRFSLSAPGADEFSLRPTERPPARSANARHGARNLRTAMVRLVRKLEGMGIDCDDVTELIGDTDG
jgi:hypothetical protein